MLRILLLFIVLCAGIVVGPILAGHQGYVLIQTENYNIETSITAVIIMLVVLLAVIFSVEWLIRRVLHTGSRTHGWFIGRKRSRAKKQMNTAMLKLAEGDHQQAEKLLVNQADHAEQPVVNYLLAAEAAQLRNDTLNTNKYLQRAAELAGKEQLPIDITRVRLQLTRGEIHAARHGIDQLLNDAPRHPEVLRLAEQIYLNSGAAHSLLELLPVMRKIRLRNDEQLAVLEQNAHIALMEKEMTENGSEGLIQWWRQQSRKTRNNTVLEAAIVERLILCDDHNSAETILLTSVKRNADIALLQLIPQLHANQPAALEKVIRQYMKSKENGTNSAELHSILGRFLLNNGQWQEAYEQLNTSLSQHPNTQDYAAIADALDHLNRQEEATAMRHAGLSLTVN